MNLSLDVGEYSWDAYPAAQAHLTAINKPTQSAELVQPEQSDTDLPESVRSARLPVYRDVMHKLSDTDLRLGWHINDNVAIQSNNTRSIISTDPTVVAKVREFIDKDDRYKKQWITSRSKSIGSLALAGTEVVGAAITGAGLTVSFGVPEIGFLGAIAGGLAGILTSLPSVWGYRKLHNKLSKTVHEKESKELAEKAAQSSQTYVVPGLEFADGNISKSLSKCVANILLNEEYPSELLTATLSPLVGSILQAHTEIDEIEPKIDKIRAREKIIDSFLLGERATFNILYDKKCTLTDLVRKNQKILVDIRDAQIAKKLLKKKLVDSSPAIDALKPACQDLSKAVGETLLANYDHNLSDNYGKAADTMIAALQTVQDDNQLGPIYTALKEKWQKDGIQLPDYVVLQEQIAKKRELR